MVCEELEGERLKAYMRNKSFVALFSSFLFVAAIGCFAFVIASSHTSNGARRLVSTLATVTPDAYQCNTTPHDTPPIGAPGITPRTNDAVAFSELDVRDYYRHNTNEIIDRVEFITSDQACLELEGLQTGLPPDVMVCLVHFHGINPAGTADGGRPFKEVDVFDAHTGNLLVAKPTYL